MNKIIKVEFGVPINGWMPFYFDSERLSLELNVSNVPNEPIIMLCNSMIQICKGLNKTDRIVLHLEPNCYYLEFSKHGDNYSLIVEESERFESSITATEEIQGSFNEIVMPFYRVVKKFWSKSYEPPHWNEIDSEKIDELTQLIKRK